ncbi:MAG TPA: FtsX-like permease family protein [Ktedonobacteraceae bacterium]|nr:FtsX-like permease family protein [Ktedonobacteraceae bacterium]
MVEEPPTRYPVLMSNTTYLSALEQEIQHATPPNQVVNSVLTTNLQFFWYYPLDTSRFDVSGPNTLIIQLNQVLGDLSNNSIYPPYVERTAASGPLDALALYSSRVAVVNIPLTSMACLIVLVVLLFVSLMTDVLVNRQSEAIALLRSRGASRGQVFVSLVLQSIGVGLLALLLGPALAVFASLLLAHTLLSSADQGAINVLATKNPLLVAWGLRWLALLTVGVGVFAMVISIALSIRADMLTMRREAARSTYRPLWQRFRLDLFAAVVALVGYAFSIYITSPGVLNERVRVLILPLVTVVGALFLLLGCILLLLRFLPLLLRFVAQLAVRGRSATPVLALAQMARAPRQPMRAAGNLQLSGLNDRFATIEALRHDPLNLAISGLISIGVVTTMLLAIIGNLILSYLSARSHLVNFAVMKALGSTAQQVASVLLWEQAMVYAAAIILGIAFGSLFSAIALPGLVFTGVAQQNGNANQASGGQFYILQNVPPVQIVIPIWLLIIVLGILLSICTVAVGMMARAIAGVPIIRVLRLSQD